MAQVKLVAMMNVRCIKKKVRKLAALRGRARANLFQNIVEIKILQR
jgi:hypothetical protein